MLALRISPITKVQIIVGLLFAGLAGSALADAFERGSVGVTLGIGTGQVNNNDYYTVGLGVNYYVLNGLSLSLYGETRQGIEPTINKLSPGIGYVFSTRGPIKPYVGAFYRRTYVENFDDFDAYGGRAGVYLAMGGNAYLSIGGVYEKLHDCQDTATIKCSDAYGEIGLTFAF
ncbi:MAG: hypothetical protein JSW09_08240 [Pseudomonadota bacterium]|nr:MAG: hypothetical protein JSW09_08240 [Pseudomonadota bacterium]